MPFNPLYLQQKDTISQTIGSFGFLSASDDLRMFINERGGLVNGIYTLPDPHVKGFKPFFHHFEEYGLLADSNNFDSAEAYLRRIGQTKRADLLAKFKDVLKELSSEYSHQFMTVEQMETSYTDYRKMAFEENPTIKLNLFETLDTKVNFLNQAYKQIVWDSQRKVEVLPLNMRQFTMSIYIYDANFYTTSLDFLATFENQDLANINHTMFEYSFCEFTPDSGSSFFDTITRMGAGAEPSVNDLTLSYKKSEISSLFKNITGNTQIDTNVLDIFSSAILSFVVQQIDVLSGNPYEIRPPIPIPPISPI